MSVERISNASRLAEGREFTPLHVFIIKGGPQCSDATLSQAYYYFNYEFAWRKYLFPEIENESTQQQDCIDRGISCHFAIVSEHEIFMRQMGFAQARRMVHLSKHCLPPVQDTMTHCHSYEFNVTICKIKHMHYDYDYNEIVERYYKEYVNTACKDGFTPLHVAATLGEEKFIKALLENGADVNAVDNENNTPLHISIYWAAIHARGYAYEEAVLLLLEAGADINIKNDKGYSVADVARDKICDPAIETEAKFICEYVFPDYAEKEVVGIVDNTASDEVL
jgi:ankyrin repeat protein